MVGGVGSLVTGWDGNGAPWYIQAGVGAIIGDHTAVDDAFNQAGQTYKNSWTGMAYLAGGLAESSIPGATLLAPFALNASRFLPGKTGKDIQAWLRQDQAALPRMVGGLIGIQLPEDPYDPKQWKNFNPAQGWVDNPGETAGESLLNIGTFAAPGAGEAAAGAHTAATAAETLDGVRLGTEAADGTRGLDTLDAAHAATAARGATDAADAATHIETGLHLPDTPDTLLSERITLPDAAPWGGPDHVNPHRDPIEPHQDTVAPKRHVDEPSPFTGHSEERTPDAHSGTNESGAAEQGGNRASHPGAGASDSGAHDGEIPGQSTEDGSPAHDPSALHSGDSTATDPATVAENNEIALHKYEDIPTPPPDGTPIDSPEVSSWVDQVHTLHPELSKPEIRGVWEYTTGGYRWMNDYLRNPVSINSEHLARLNDTIDGLSKLPTYEGPTYRGLDLPADLTHLKSGDPYTPSAFSSSTLDVSVAHRFIPPGATNPTMMILDGKTGVSVDAFSAYRGGEAEILFTPGTHYQVVENYVGADGIRILAVKEVRWPMATPDDFTHFPQGLSRAEFHEWTQRLIANNNSRMAKYDRVSRPINEAKIHDQPVVEKTRGHYFQLHDGAWVAADAEHSVGRVRGTVETPAGRILLLEFSDGFWAAERTDGSPWPEGDEFLSVTDNLDVRAWQTRDPHRIDKRSEDVTWTIHTALFEEEL